MSKQDRFAREESQDIRLKFKELLITGYDVDMTKCGERIGTISIGKHHCVVKYKNKKSYHPLPRWYVMKWDGSRENAKQRGRTGFGGWLDTEDEVVAFLNNWLEKYENEVP
jgi:hypothetical protein